VGTAHGIALTLGGILLSAGILKVYDLPLFVRQIKAYGIIPFDAILPSVAWAVVASQFALGAALILFYLPRLVLGTAAALFSGLAGLTAWAWFTGATDSCGCYGTLLQQSPRTATFENLLLMLLAVAGLILLGPVSLGRSRFRGWAVAAASLAGLVLPMVFGLPNSGTMHVLPKQTQSPPWNLEGAGAQGHELSRGTHLVVLMSVGCHECIDALPKLYSLAETGGIPPILGLVYGEQDQIDRFREEFQPTFRIEAIGERDFWRLLGTGNTPRLILVKDGRAVRTWDGTIPEPDAIQAVLPNDPAHGRS
jgi:hypothetical protein